MWADPVILQRKQANVFKLLSTILSRSRFKVLTYRSDKHHDLQLLLSESSTLEIK